MRLALAHARAETLRYVRFPAYAVPTLLFPGLLMLLVGRSFVRGEPERMLVGFAAMAVLTVTFFQFGVGIGAVFGGTTCPRMRATLTRTRSRKYGHGKAGPGSQ